MGGSTAGGGDDGKDDEFERTWQALTEQLGDLKPAELPDEDHADTRKRGRRTDDGQTAGRIGASASPQPDGGADGPADTDWSQPADYAMSGPRDYEPAEEDGFVPPEPEPITVRHRPLLVAGWIGLTVSALCLLGCAIVRSVPSVIPQAAGAVLLISFGLLLSQLPKGRHDNDDDPGRGAVV